MMSGEMSKILRGSVAATAAAAVILQFAVSLAMAQALDFENYRTRVEPVFLRKRPGHARCIACHEAGNSAFRLQPLTPGNTTWSEEQSRRNFENVTHLVTPGNPDTSKLLIHPLAHEGGGDEFHSGGRQFASKNDAEWMAIAAWIRQTK